MPAGTAPRPTIHRHPLCIWKKPAPIPYAMTWPRVIMTTLRRQSDEVKDKSMCLLYTSKQPSFHADGWETIPGCTRVQCMQPNQPRCRPKTVRQSGNH